jgi:hypothetical protein
MEKIILSTTIVIGAVTLAFQLRDFANKTSAGSSSDGRESTSGKWKVTKFLCGENRTEFQDGRTI